MEGNKTEHQSRKGDALVHTITHEAKRVFL
ncbi:hypothetical protein AJ85_01530 [Alkalihalobacillus alcalophilus ATCC 27647 = CGMCC 1.3604]|uniref:Uncharacterized protein n=1 Tax=Alkalihalobacillus alcalophilus ATCC 27647 = CGMCC 1.3604 TaxID=1218173 RepID=A0A4S4K6Q8_ALKAL|nr:hypothetical protein AJ85_01530 [Alkalihalobacillus alcalophilus ATCC 27647 = CGMCC 1.3604]